MIQGLDSALPLLGALVKSLVGEVRSSMPCGVATKRKKKASKSHLQENMGRCLQAEESGPTQTQRRR